VKELSPAAQTVRLAAICAGPELEGRLAAALRAAVVQVVPDIRYVADCLDEPVESELQRIRNRFFDIATELEAQP
jgi:hypothetical protein